MVHALSSNNGYQSAVVVSSLQSSLIMGLTGLIWVLLWMTAPEVGYQNPDQVWLDVIRRASPPM